jgi:putative membrane protein insertion efficiency factor
VNSVPLAATTLPRARRALLLAAGVIAALLTWDLARPPASQWTAWSAITLIHAYQRTGAPFARSLGARCRFTLTCSQYAETLIRRHGLVAGGLRATRRLLRCGPWTAPGTVDPP